MRAGPIGALAEETPRSDSSPGIFIPDRLPFIQWKSSRTIVTADWSASANTPFNLVHQAAAFRRFTIGIRTSIFTTYEIISEKTQCVHFITLLLFSQCLFTEIRFH